MFSLLGCLPPRHRAWVGEAVSVLCVVSLDAAVPRLVTLTLYTDQHIAEARQFASILCANVGMVKASEGTLYRLP